MKHSYILILLSIFMSVNMQAQITDTIKNASDTIIAPVGILTQAQVDSIAKTEEAIEYRKNHTDYYVLRKGRIFGSWGYNRSSYSPSTIRFWGDGYDFTVNNATAHDRQTKFDPAVYFNPSLLTIPQYNLRIGYYLTNKISLTFNVDHMKYVFDNPQNASVEGYIDSSASEKYAKVYDPTRITNITDEFIRYEHTDGLNLVGLELDYNSLFFETSNRKFAADLIAGVGLSAAVPKTNATLFGTLGNDAFHLAGAGISGNVGVKLFFFKRFYIHPTVKVGWVYMPNVATNGLENDKASQNISYFQGNFTIGYQYKIAHK